MIHLPSESKNRMLELRNSAVSKRRDFFNAFAAVGYGIVTLVWASCYILGGGFSWVVGTVLYLLCAALYPYLIIMDHRLQREIDDFLKEIEEMEQAVREFWKARR